MLRTIVPDKNDDLQISMDVIRRASEGEIPAFEQIYRSTSGFVYRVCLGVTKNEHDAQELTQEIFLKIHKELTSFRQESSFKTWIYRVAMNHALNHQRAMGRMRDRHAEFQKDADASLEADGGRRADAWEQVRKMLEALNEDQQQCMILRHVEGLSYEEIAETLSININTVRSRLKRARETLLARKESLSDGV